MYEKNNVKEEEQIDKPLFDIVAGTSIGAINAAILVNYVVENKTWKGSAEKLNEFWDYVSAESYADATPGFTSWWDYWSNIDDTLASGEGLVGDTIHQKNLNYMAFQRYFHHYLH